MPESGDIAIQATQTAGAAATIVGVAAHAAWVPLIGPIVAGVTLGLAAIFARKSGRQKTAATAIVDDLEPLLAENRDGYLAGPRTQASQTAALKNFDDAWAFLASSQACGSAELGDAGRRCISERARGGRWDWFGYYRDPIAEDTPRPDVLGLPLPNAVLAATENWQRWIVPAALAGAALLMTGEGRR